MRVGFLFKPKGGYLPNMGPKGKFISTPSITNLWSDPATWGGAVPLATDAVTISAGQTVYVDTAAVALSVDVQGSLIWTQTASASLTTGNINIGGAGLLQIGTEAAPYPSTYTATITLNGTESGRTTRTVSGTNLGFTNNGVGRSLQVQPGGKLSLIGVAPTVKRTKLNAHAAASTNTFTLADSTGWLAGNEIVIGTTDFFGVSEPEKLTLQTNASGTTIQTTTTIAAPRWGVMQYVTDAGMSLTAGTLTSPPAGTPTTLDERAMVINLTRNIVIQGANDTAWTTSKFGAHCMFMGRTSDIKLDGVQFRRVGQAGAIGRYPIHWHMMSYNMPSGMNAPSDGTFVGAVVGSHYAKNCSVSESGQRMIVIHGTWGVTLDANVGFDITGHAIFLEDGSERDNFITNNVVMKVRAPTSGNKLLNHDSAAANVNNLGVNGTIGTACYWNTNPANTWQNNWANDSEGAGFWASFSENYFGLSINVPNTTTGPTPNPLYTPLTLIEGTVSIGHKGAGQLTNDRVINDKGDTGQLKYEGNFLSAPIKNLQLYKNAAGGYSNRIDRGKYENFICADNAGMDVFGQATVADSVMHNSLVVAESLNNATSRRVSSYRAAFATYHELLNFKNCTCVGYTYINGTQISSNDVFAGGGLFRLWDLYIQGIFTFNENTGLKLIGCDAPFRTLPSFKDGAALNNRNWQVTGAIKDTHNIFGGAGKWWVLDDAFLTYGASGLTNVTAGVPANGKWTTDNYFGIKVRGTAFSVTTADGATQNFTRQDPSTGTTVGTWNIGSGFTSVMLGNMRSAAMHNGGRYKIEMPDESPGNYFEFTSHKLDSAGDNFTVGVPFDLATNPNPIVYQQGWRFYPRDGTGRADVAVGTTAGAVASGEGRYLTSTTSIANVVADTTGLLYYRDVAANVVWIKIKTNAVQLATNWSFANAEGLEYKSTGTVITA